MNLTEHLRAQPELVSLDRATLYLASRVRSRTPLGASEYLQHKCFGGQVAPVTRKAITRNERLTIALECMRIYRTIFPVEWHDSTSPYLSVQREQELYVLIDEQCFPFRVDAEVDVDSFIQADPQFFSPFIPLRGQQSFEWMTGDFTPEETGPAFWLALALSRQLENYGRENAAAFSWEALRAEYGLPETLTPAPPFATVGWSLFNYSCQVEETPLVNLPLAFHFISYKTGNAWTDLPPVGRGGFAGMACVHWSLEKIAELTMAQMTAQRMGDAITDLTFWLHEDPVPRITQAVELWNDAAEKERQSGGEGLLFDERGELARRENWF